jgi:hypothetical protein
MNIGSKLTVAKNLVTSKAGRQLLKTQKASPTILFGAGVIGVVATAVMASRATLKLEDVLHKNEHDQMRANDLLAKDSPRYTAKDYTKDVATLKTRLVLDVAKLYAPAIVLGIGSICALTGSHVILSRRNAGLAAAYTALDKSFKDYRKRVTEFVGSEKERELRMESETREIDFTTADGVEGKALVNTVKGDLSEYAKFFSKETSNSWSPQADYNLVFLRAQQQYMNDKLRASGHVFLNEVYDALGLERTPAGAVTGWVLNNKKGGDNFVDFGIFTDENRDAFHEFMTSREGAIWLDFNVDGVVYDLI